MTDTCRYRLRARILLALLWVVSLSCVAGYANKIFSDKASVREASKFQALGEALERTNVAYWEWDPQTDEMKWSTYLWRIFGVTPDRQETREFWSRLIVDEDRERMLETIRHAAQDKASYVTHYRVNSDSGESFDILETAAWDPGRNVVIALCVRTNLKEGEDISTFLHRMPAGKL
jgi:PAS domain S-box-containing protein